MNGEKREKPLKIGTDGTLRSQAQTPPPVADRLESWKEIAAFLGRTERTVMRYEGLGMPVHRLPGAKRSRVTASRAELIKWLVEPREDSPPPEVTAPGGGRFTNRHAIVSSTIMMVIIVAAIAIAVLRRPLPPPLPAEARLTGESLTALDSDGKTLWTYAFHRKLNTVLANPPMQFTVVADLMNDGDREVIAIIPYALGQNERDGTEYEIGCFSSRGKRLWSYISRDTFQFGAHELHGPWQVLDLIVSHQGTKKGIYVDLVHNAWGNSFVVELDPTTGLGTVRYVNSGTIRVLSELQLPQVTYLIAGGFNNEFDGGSAALINERKRFSASPQTAGTRHKCTSCPEGAPDYYLVFPRSEGNRIRKEYENPIKRIHVTGNEVQFEKYEAAGGRINDGHYLIGFSPRIHPISVRCGSSYDLEHHDLERSGELRHSLEQCPERLHPNPVRMWTPTLGWTELGFGPSGFDR